MAHHRNLKISEISQYPKTKEPDMASLLGEHRDPGSRNATQTPTASCVRTTKSALEHFQEYRRQRPGVVALWCVGIGFVLGWKLKLW
jgi:hypothetical protein